jgi:putative ABC transport system permease protein
MGIALRQGRDFTDSDAEGAPRVAIVDEAMARRYWRLGENPVGRRIALDLEAYRFYRDRPPELDIAAGLRTIVGVVGGVRQTGLDTDAKPTMYVPAAQQPSREMTLVVRASSAPGVLERELETVVRAIDPEQPVPGVRALDALVAASLARPRLNANVLNAFGMLALLLAVTGLYGVTLCVVNERTREFAVRLALGAEPRDIVWLMLRRSSAVVGAGLACGLAAAAAASGLIRSLLFGVGALDVATYIAAALLMSAVAAVGCYVPARRVFRMDPNTALRSE